MVVDERSRHQLYRRLEEVLGADAATTLIEHLPPVGWADVATRQDLVALEQRMELRFARVDDRFDHIDDRFAQIDEHFDHIAERFDHIDERLELRFDSMEDRMKASMSDLRADFEHELRSQVTTVVFGLVTVVLSMAALAFALVRFT